MLRAMSIFVKDRVAQAHLGVEALQSLVMQGDLQNFIGGPSVDKSQYVRVPVFSQYRIFINKFHIILHQTKIY